MWFFSASHILGVLKRTLCVRSAVIISKCLARYENIGQLVVLSWTSIKQGTSKWLIKVARHSTSSIFESLIPKQIDLCYRNIITHITHGLNFIMILIFWEIRIYIMWQWHHNSLSSKSNYCPYQHFLWKCFMLRNLGVLVICCVKFHKNLSEEFRQFEISLNFYKKGINYAWTEAGLNADKFATFWRFPKNFYHSFILQMTFIHSTTG